MKKEKTVQIPESLFFDLVRYHLAGINDDKDINAHIHSALTDRLDRAVMREIYTTYLTAPTEEEREQARQKYLDRRGVPASFRRSTTKEQS